MTETLILDSEVKEGSKAKKANKESFFKIDVEKNALLKALSHVQNVVEKRTTVAILSHIKLEAKADSLTIYATDMDLEVVEHINASSNEEAELALPAHTLYEIVRKMPDNSTITMESDLNNQGQIKIHSGQCYFMISYLPASEFPLLDNSKFITNFELPAKTLKEIIDKTKFAISTEETRYNLNGINLHIHQGKILRAVATDCHKLALYEIELPKGADNMPSIIMPRKAVYELRKLIDETSDMVDIGVSENKICFKYGHITLVSKLIDGVFPDYESAIPKQNDKVMEARAAELARAIDRVSTITSDKFRSVRFAIKANALNISASSEANSFADENLEVIYSSEPMEIGFNFRYMLEMLSVIKSDTIELCFSDPYSPAILKDGSDEAATFVIMPMRVE